MFSSRTSFDPRTDTIVRVSARRLRTKLEEYYRTDGLTETIVITLPKGRYVPEFRSRPRPGTRVGALAARDFVGFQKLARGDDRRESQPAFHLPAPRNALIGREHDLGTVRDLLQRADVRFVTLTGVGGSGKTRLALEAASTVRADFPGGVSFVSMAGISDANAVAPYACPGPWTSSHRGPASR
jgi:hypothetical protein